MDKKKVIACIENIAPLAFAEKWDFSGVQIESKKNDIKHLIVALDPILSTVQKAIELDADMILTHHPLSLEPYRLNSINALHEVVRLLLCNDVNLYAAHTSLDAQPLGQSRWLVQELQLQDLTVLEAESGIGFVGSLQVPVTVEELVDNLLQCMPFVSKADFRFISCNLRLNKNIQKIACCTGSGSSLIDEAIKAQADVFITGDMKYHTALDVAEFYIDAGFMMPHILDVGHFCLEEEMMRRFAMDLRKQLNTIKVTFIEGYNPFHSFIDKA